VKEFQVLLNKNKQITHSPLEIHRSVFSKSNLHDFCHRCCFTSWTSLSRLTKVQLSGRLHKVISCLPMLHQDAWSRWTL